MDVIATAAILLGAVLLVGAGVFALWIVPRELARRVGRPATVGLALGAGLVIVGSFGDVAITVARVLRATPDVGFLVDYLLATRHGHAVLARAGLALAMAAWGVPRLRRAAPGRAVDRTVHGTLSLALLASIARVSHAGPMGIWPTLGDLAHLVGATVWAGGLIYLAATPLWRERALPVVVRRISTIGVAGVGLLIATGVYLSVLHLFGVAALTTTAYGVSLLVKLALVSIVLALAGINRWWLVPLLEHDRAGPLRSAVRIEAILLATVLVVTAVLSTREPAHDPGDPAHAHAARPHAAGSEP